MVFPVLCALLITSTFGHHRLPHLSPLPPPPFLNDDDDDDDDSSSSSSSSNNNNRQQVGHEDFV